jgi:hypothetical protein
LKDSLPMTMADTGKALPVSRSCFQFWYFGVLRLFVGLAQIAAVIWCAVLLLGDGFSTKAMRAVFVAAGITTLSLVLFKILHRRNEQVGTSVPAGNCNNEET